MTAFDERGGKCVKQAVASAQCYWLGRRIAHLLHKEPISSIAPSRLEFHEVGLFVSQCQKELFLHELQQLQNNLQVAAVFAITCDEDISWVALLWGGSNNVLHRINEVSSGGGVKQREGVINRMPFSGLRFLVQVRIEYPHSNFGGAVFHKRV